MAADSKTLYTADGDAIPWLQKDVSNHLDKTTLIFGGSGSGKTTMIEEILYLIKDHIPNYLVIAPKTSDTAYRKKLPARCIKEDLTKEKLQQIWRRQVHATQIYNMANDLDTLESLFSRIPSREHLVIIELIKKRAAEMIKLIEASPNLDFGQKRAQRGALEEHLNKKIKALYVEAITKNKSNYERIKDLTKQEMIALEYLGFNPRFCLIIDDCSEMFQTWMKYFTKREENVFECIFYKGRHNFITLIFASHDDKLVNTEFRKNARITFYMNSQALVASLDKKGNGFTPTEKKKALNYTTRIFGDDGSNIKTHQKMCYVREDSHPFKYTIANLYPDFTLGSMALHNMINKMPKKDDNIDDNPFIKDLVKKKGY